MSRRIPARVALAVICSLAMLSTPADGGVAVSNYMSAAFSADDSGMELYEYGTGVDKTADFATGTHTDTVENGGALELDLPGVPADWWDTDYRHRHCFDVKSTDTVAEYPLRFEVDTSATSTNGDDIRVVVGTNGALLDSYSEGPFTNASSIVWAQAEPLPAGVSFYCVYFDNPAATSVSDELAVFTSSTGQTTSYYTMLDTYSNTALQVVSYSNNNTVSDGTVTVNLNQGQLHTFTGANRNTVITATGPIEGSAEVNAAETILPESFASDSFVFPVQRGVNRAWVRSPFGNTTIQAIVNGAVVSTLAITPASGSLQIAGDFGADDTLILRSTDGTDFLAMYKSTAQRDVGPAVPFYGDPIYGIRSTQVKVGAIGSANVQMQGSDGTSLSGVVSDTATATVTGGPATKGSGPAFKLTSNGPVIAANQHADADGLEITTFYPQRKLSETWRLPIKANYYSVACPVNPTMVTVGGVPFNCASANAAAPGKFYSGLGAYPAGTTITADHPIYVYYEETSSVDEHNLVGIRGAIPYLADHGYGPRPVENLNLPGLCGEWTSAPLPAAGVFGLASVADLIPAGTSATYQISTDGSGFYGPDGTAASSFSAGDIVPYVGDFASTLQLRIDLCTNDGAVTPTVTEFTIECDLQELVHPFGSPAPISLASPESGTLQPVLRIYQQNAGAWLGSVQYADGLNLGVTKASFDTDHPTNQITANAGTVASPSPTFAHATNQPYTLWVDHKTLLGQSSEIEVNVVDELGVRTETPVRFTFIG